jgi:UDP-GlcNAc:undecaprenyl-phosphate/decaprenyl-phosphate GlcNAc-1-phosphate transferase
MKAVRSAAVAAAAARLSYALLRAKPPGGSATWTRTNHRGEPITLLEGPAVAIGAVAGVLAGSPGSRSAIASAVAGIGAAGFGGYDDLEGNGDSRGFRGHIGALRKGELTTGAVKIAGIGATGLAAAIIAGGADRPGGATGPGGTDGGSPVLAAADVLINAGLIAGGANLLNLFDLRPGRAIKVAGVAGALLAAAGRNGPEAAAPLAAAAALLPEDLGERSMLGDAGANALGAMLGVAAATSLSRRTRVAALAAVVGLTAASEVVSFTRVIERTAPLRWADMLGRRPAASADAAEASGPAGPDTPAAADGSAGPDGSAEAGGSNGADGSARIAGDPGAHMNGERAPEAMRSAEAR